MEKFLCTYCGKLTSLAKCPDCGRGTIPNLPNSGNLNRLEAPIPRYPHNIPFVPITKVEASIIEKALSAAPYYALKYGEQGLLTLNNYIDKKKQPTLYWLIWGITKGISYVKRKLYVE